jgi:hypothetical protein
LHVDKSFVDTFLLCLDGGLQVLQTLVGLGDVGDQGCQLVGARVSPGRSGRQSGRAEQQSDANYRSHGRPAQPRGQPETRAAIGTHHPTRVSYG